MEQRDDEPPPFWLQNTTTRHHAYRHHRRSSSLFLNTGMLVMFLLVTAIIFLAIVIPSVVSLLRQVFNPTLVKSSWNSLNILLVIFAIVCGFLSRKDDDQTPVNTPTKKDGEYQENIGYNSFGNLDTLTRLRSSSSYPDLRHQSDLLVTESNLRFYDDTNQFRRSFRKTVKDEDHGKAKTIEVDTFVRKTQEISYDESTSSSQSVIDEVESRTKNIDVVPQSYFWPSPPPPPPPPSPPRRGHSSTPTTRKKTNQTFETIGHGRYKWKSSSEVREPKLKVKQQPPPPPPPPTRLKPVLVAHFTENKKPNNDRKRGGVNVTKEFFNSFYHQSKTKRKPKRRSYENLKILIEPPKTLSIHRSKSTPEFPPPSPPRPPPPPPPPPPHSVFQTLFSKKGKNKKKVHSTSTSSTPRPPPPPPCKRPTKKPIKNDSFTSMENDENGKETHLRPIPPPPPPPPPFKMKPWKFVVKGDYVKIKSNNNNITPRRDGYSSDDEEDNESISSISSLFSPSPDVNIKADDFIARFRANLNLEKSDSINLRQGTPATSRLRPDSFR